MGKGKKKKKKGPQRSFLCRNKKARHDFFIEETLEAGIVLQGSEVKSIRAGRVSLNEAYVAIHEGEAFLVGAHVSEWPYSHARNHEPTRRRKLLLHAREIRRLIGKIQEKGFTLVPLSMYLKNGKIKVEIGLAKGKRKYDKREAIRRRDQERDRQAHMD